MNDKAQYEFWRNWSAYRYILFSKFATLCIICIIKENSEKNYSVSMM